MQVYHSQKFKSKDNASAVKCSLKANEGLLYPLDKALMFIYKPTLYIPYKDIETVTFDRVGGSVGESTRAGPRASRLACPRPGLMALSFPLLVAQASRGTSTSRLR